MNPGIRYYMDAGLPATGQITFNRAPNTQPPLSATLSVTIGTYTYQWTPVGAATFLDFCGETGNQIAISLCAAINAQQNRSDITANNQPIKSHYAMYFNNVVTVISTIPGTYGNTIGLSATSSDTGCVSVSGATFTGGTFGGLSRNTILVTPPGSTNGVAQVAATSTPCSQAFFYGIKALTQIASSINYTCTANSATVYIGEINAAGNVIFCDSVATATSPPFLPTVYQPPNGNLDLKNFYLLTPTSGDSVLVKYA